MLRSLLEKEDENFQKIGKSKHQTRKFDTEICIGRASMGYTAHVPCFIVYQRKNVVSYFATLTLSMYMVGYSIEVAIFNGDLTRLTVQKSILFGSCDEVKTHKSFLCLPAMAHVTEYSKPANTYC